MPTFNNVFDAHDTTVPQCLVEVSPNAPIPVGQHRFQLVVVDSDDNASVAATAEVLVKALDRPTARLEIRPSTVELGKSFTLIGEGSTDIPPGKLKSFHWTRIS
jgi:hypothetical protein